MTDTDREPARNDGTEVALELYKTAFSRLTFQDEYLFKFSTVFLTVHGALVALARSAFPEKSSPIFGILLATSAFGLFLSYVWLLWTKHNDYWHSVWTGVLIKIEQSHFKEVTPVFAAKHEDMAKRDRAPPSRVGHKIAQLIPVGIGIAWGFAFMFAVFHYCPAVQPTAQGPTSPPSAGTRP